MPKLHTASRLAAAFAARYPQPGIIDVAAAGEVVFPTDSTSLDSVQAAGVRSFTAPGRMQHVKVVEHFLVLGETMLPGEFVELPESDAKHVVNSGRAQFATPAEVAAAQTPAKAGK